MSTTSNLADFIDRFAIQMAADLDFYHPVMSGFIEGLKHAAYLLREQEALLANLGDGQ